MRTQSFLKHLLSTVLGAGNTAANKTDKTLAPTELDFRREEAEGGWDEDVNIPSVPEKKEAGKGDALRRGKQILFQSESFCCDVYSEKMLTTSASTALPVCRAPF